MPWNRLAFCWPSRDAVGQALKSRDKLVTEKSILAHILSILQDEAQASPILEGRQSILS